jgi:hypothetical protein
MIRVSRLSSLQATWFIQNASAKSRCKSLAGLRTAGSVNVETGIGFES